MRSGEVEISTLLHRDEMIVDVRDIKSCKRRTDSLASGSCFDGFRDFFCNLKQCCVVWLREIRKMIYFDLGYDEGMSERMWMDVEKGEDIFILIDLVARDLTSDDAREDSHTLD